MSVFGVIIGSILWGIVLSTWTIVRRPPTQQHVDASIPTIPTKIMVDKGTET
jgi:hypothetical protein